ncbi:hypothetical protein Bca4012_068507 [Brassica carinata]|uniref:Uncharacterized protein n=1 Tax=Brassica carinata TaxID=52824 RepID=A0A8X8ASL7_BRACI|nr:hypothetical protein Bca52824_022064 [Brassica carinata]
MAAPMTEKEAMVDPFLVEALKNPRHRLTKLGNHEHFSHRLWVETKAVVSFLHSLRSAWTMSKTMGWSVKLTIRCLWTYTIKCFNLWRKETKQSNNLALKREECSVKASSSATNGNLQDVFDPFQSLRLKQP